MTSMPPIARKKQVPNKYTPNTYRVISKSAESIPHEPRRHVIFKADSDYNVIGQSEDTHPSQEFRHNKPHPGNIGFLRQNVNLMLEPVCHVQTKTTDDEQHLWWPSRTSNEPLKVPPFTLDSVSRDDYQWRGSDMRGNTRHTSNPNKTPVDGIVPVHHFKQPNGKQRFWKEKISYEHKYDCRLDPSYPIRAKRHGGFVWDEFPPSEVAKMLQYFGYNADKEVQTSNENNAPKNKATQASTTNEINNNTENSSTKQTQPLSMQHAGDGLPPVCN